MTYKFKTSIATGLLASTLVIGCQPEPIMPEPEVECVMQIQAEAIQEERRVSELSKSIADYLVENGRNPFSEDGAQKEGYPNHYQIRRQLEDGRTLRAYFVNGKQFSTENPARNSRLEITIRPAREDQFGYELQERGLAGEFELFRVLTGTDRDPVRAWVHFTDDAVGDLNREWLQERYELVMQDVNETLYGQ